MVILSTDSEIYSQVLQKKKNEDCPNFSKTEICASTSINYKMIKFCNEPVKRNYNPK